MNVPINAFKYLVWQHNGCEGWSWEGYNTIEEAVKHESYGSKKIITTPVKIKIEDITPALDTKQVKMCPVCHIKPYPCDCLRNVNVDTKQEKIGSGHTGACQEGCQCDVAKMGKQEKCPEQLIVDVMIKEQHRNNPDRPDKHTYSAYCSCGHCLMAHLITVAQVTGTMGEK